MQKCASGMTRLWAVPFKGVDGFKVGDSLQKRAASAASTELAGLALASQRRPCRQPTSSMPLPVAKLTVPTLLSAAVLGTTVVLRYVQFLKRSNSFTLSSPPFFCLSVFLSSSSLQYLTPTLPILQDRAVLNNVVFRGIETKHSFKPSCKYGEEGYFRDILYEKHLRKPTHGEVEFEMLKHVCHSFSLSFFFFLVFLKIHTVILLHILD